ncbi:HdeD family acid-resistance protein [Neisseriaceae bacterium ESL0693]|nr:HdeD family acid-resistance protein [Neisseriaceae bacterium ESL0693]
MDTTSLNLNNASMAGLLSKTWWLLLLRGLAAVIFGLLTWFQPAITLLVLVIFFGAYTLVDGIFGLVAAFQGRRTHPDWWILLLWALVSIVVGILTFCLPGITAYALLCLIAAWAIIAGLFQIAAAIKLRKQVAGEVWMIVGGILSVLFGIALFVWPVSGAVAIAWLIGIYAFIFGIVNIIAAFRVRRLAH